MFNGWLILAQAPEQTAWRIMFWLAVLVLAAVVLGALGWALRKWLLREQEPEVGTGFGLSELRRMRDAGQLSEEEFQSARRLIVARTRQATGGLEAEDLANGDSAPDSDKTGPGGPPPA
jgi:hypothetical protein